MTTTTGLVHPTHLLRSNSRERVFAAPRNVNVGLYDNYDCGISNLPFMSKMCNLHRYANVSVFVCCLSVLGCLQGMSYAYYKETSKIWMKQFRFSEQLAEYLTCSSHIFSGIFALVVAYWGNRIHRPSWIGGLAIFQSVSALAMIVPETYHPTFLIFDSNTVSNYDGLCLSGSEKLSNLAENCDEKVYIAVVFFAIYQLFYSLSAICYFCLGISYVDDHVKYKNTVACVCILFVTAEFGRQIGIYYSYIPALFHRHIFYSAVWIVTSLLIFGVGLCISMFAKELPSKILARGVASILDLTTVEQQKIDQSASFYSVMAKILRSRVILLTTAAASVAFIGTTNYDLMRNEFFRVKATSEINSTFSSYTEPRIHAFFSNFIIQTVTVISFISTAAFLAKFQPGLRSLIGWLISIYAKVALLFIASAFLKCANNIYTDHKNFKSFCNLNCHCNLSDFNPVCSTGNEKITFYSPCYAGCTAKEGSIFKNCSCLGGEATEGYCDEDDCQAMWILSEANNVLIVGLMACAMIINILLVIKSSPKGYTAVGLAIFFTGLQLLPYFPFKLVYHFIKGYFCSYYNNQHNCTVYSSNFPKFVDVITTVLLVLSTLIALGLLFCYEKVDLYGLAATSFEGNHGLTEVGQPRANNISATVNSPVSYDDSEEYGDDDIDDILREMDEEVGNGRHKDIKTYEEDSFSTSESVRYMNNEINHNSEQLTVTNL